jgi:predicted negative regulator of RcsB-dependent stress response
MATNSYKEESNEALDKAKNFWSENQKKIVIFGSLVILMLASYIAYNNFYAEPRKLKAEEEIYMAESYFDNMASTKFNKDSVNIVLNGGNINGYSIKGVLSVIKNYDGTPTAERAKYIAGTCYYQINENDKALNYLKNFDARGALQIQMRAHIMMGNIYAAKKNTTEALTQFKKATTVNEKDEMLTPNALLICARYASYINNSKEAIDCLKKLKEKYPNADPVRNGEVDKRLASFGELN